MSPLDDVSPSAKCGDVQPLAGNIRGTILFHYSGFTLADGGKSPAKFMGVPKMQSRGSEAPEIRK